MYVFVLRTIGQFGLVVAEYLTGGCELASEYQGAGILNPVIPCVTFEIGAFVKSRQHVLEPCNLLG